MNRVGWWGAVVVLAVVYGSYLLLLALFNVLGSGGDVLSYAVATALVATPPAFAAAILWRAWWRWTGTRLPATDGPARLLATAVAILPADRRDWGVAMAVELAQVLDRRARWRFAAGCARTAVFPPSGHRVPVFSVAAGVAVAVVVTWLAVGRVLPEMRVFAVTFAVLVGVMGTVVVARTRRVHRPAQGLTGTAVGLVWVAACIAVTAYYLATEASTTLDSGVSVTLAVILAGCLWLTLAPPRALAASKHARWIGLGMGLVTSTGMLLIARTIGDTAAGFGLVMYVLLISFVAVLLASVLLAMVNSSFSAGLQATIWTMAGAILPAFAIYVVEAFRWHQANQSLYLDDDDGAIGMNLYDAIWWMLVVVPMWVVPFGIIGAALGSIGSKSRPAVEPMARG